MKIVILLPTFNERENITVLLEALSSIVSKIQNHHFRMLVIDDTSPDGTADEVRHYQKTHKEVILLNGKKEGLGKALLRGMNYAVERMDADLIIQMDADLSHDPKIITQFIDRIDKGYDFVVGSRYIPGGSIPENWGLHRKIYSIVGNAFVRYGLGYLSIHDWTGGFRAYEKKYVGLITPHVSTYNGYIFQIAFLHKAILSGANIAEVPIHFTDRQFGRSKIIFSEYIRSIIHYIFTNRWKRLRTGTFGKFLVVGGMGFFINTIVIELLVFLGIAPWISGGLGAECAIVSNFFFNNSWTFSHRKVSGLAKLRKLLKFNLTSIGALILQSMTILLGTMFAGVHTYRLWYVLGVGIGMVWNYYTYTHVIWKKQ
jgi:dolichol-phosphate mannosyltransferase